MVNVYRGKLDIKSTSSKFSPVFVQYDKGRLEIELLDGAEPYDLSTVNRVEFTHVRKDGLVIIEPGEIVGRIEGNSLCYDYKGSEMDVLGKIKTSLAIFDSENNKVSTHVFEVTVTEDLRNEIFDPAAPSAGLLEQLLEEVQYVKDNPGPQGPEGPQGPPGESNNVELENSLTSDSITKAVTAAQAKKLKDEMELSKTGYGVVPEMFSIEPGETDETAMLQRSIDYAEANGTPLKLAHNKTYIISDTLFFTNVHIDGNGATLNMPNANVPMLMHRRLVDKTSAIAYSTLIENLNFEGNMDNPNNHGLYVISFWSKYRNLEFRGVGGNAINLAYKHPDGTELASSTLVENEFHGIIIRGCGSDGLILGSDGSNKITDGTLANCLINVGEKDAIRIGGGAGWNVRDIHIYNKPNTALMIENAFNTTVHNIYIEEFTDYAVFFGAVQRNLTVSNINIDATSSNNDSTCIGFDRQLITAAENVSVALSNINVQHNDITKTNSVFKMINAVNVRVTNLGIAGDNASNVSVYSDNNHDYYNIINDSKVIGRIADLNGKYMSYEGRQLKQSHFAMFEWNDAKIIVFDLPPISEYGKILGNVSIAASKWHNGSMTCQWDAKILLSWKSSNDENVGVYVTDIIEPTGFEINPYVTVDKANNKIYIEFTASDEASTGVVTFDYIAATY